MILNTIIRSIAWTLTRKLTDDAYNKVKYRNKKPTTPKRKRNARSK